MQRTATVTEFKLLLKFQMREVYTIIQLNWYWYPPWKTGAVRQSRLLRLAPDFSKLLSEEESNEGRLAGGLATENCFFFVTPGLTGARSCSESNCTSPTSTISEMRTVVRVAVSPTADEATVSATKPTLSCISHRLPS